MSFEQGLALRNEERAGSVSDRRDGCQEVPCDRGREKVQTTETIQQEPRENPSS